MRVVERSGRNETPLRAVVWSWSVSRISSLYFSHGKGAQERTQKYRPFETCPEQRTRMLNYWLIANSRETHRLARNARRCSVGNFVTRARPLALPCAMCPHARCGEDAEPTWRADPARAPLGVQPRSTRSLSKTPCPV
jgi:hypothetical protein